ncbi:3-keto-5-aminohexanoate cleavage protein [Zavarzinia sp. CC-PAN008]|uniref:3-keto-5-aminohexanoate cleavage protein n=1 Tax=Zavarzinia sp. CC-PAN008 TaxID=3243332 RepID=UPI003F7420F7
MNRKPFITCAVTGGGGGAFKSPLVPVTPEEIANDVLAVAEAGAAIAHVHVREPDTKKPSRRTDLYAEVVERVRARNRSIILNLTGGMGGDLDVGAGADPFAFGPETDLVNATERLVHVQALRPDICTLDCGSYNASAGSLVYISTSDQIRQGAAHIRSLGVRPELELFDLGQVRFVLEMMDQGHFDAPTMIQFCLGVPYGAPADTVGMKAMADMVRGHDVIWSGFGVGPMQLPMVAQAVLLGGNVRVGLEDNIYLRRGVFATNVDLVGRAVTIIEAMGADVMGAEATRDLLGLPMRD